MRQSYNDINKTKKLSPNNYGWGIWNIETRNDKAHAFFLLDKDLSIYELIDFPYGELIDSINRFLEAKPEFRRVLIRDVFEHFLFRCS